MKRVKAWAWSITDGRGGKRVLCYWALPHRPTRSQKRPTEDARAVPVWISVRKTKRDRRKP